MKYKEEIIINGRITAERITPNSLWHDLEGFLASKKILGNEYKISLGLHATSSKDLGYTKLAKTCQISEFLKCDKGEPVLSIWQPPSKGIGNLQKFSYFCKLGNFTFSGRFSNSPDDWDEFISTSTIRENITNILVKTRSFVAEMTPFLSPPNSNLYLAPGLANDRGDYLQGVSAEMWLGESFWQHASCTKEQFLAQDWLKCDIREHHTHVEAYHEPFTTTEGEQGEIQRRLLKLLFDIDENNPCGNKGTPPQKTKEFRLEVEVDKQGNVTETKPIQQTKKRWWKK